MWNSTLFHRSPTALHRSAARLAPDEFIQQRQKKRFAEIAERRLGLQMERPAHDVLIVFVQHDPEPESTVQARAMLLGVGNLGCEAIPLPVAGW